MRSFIRITLVIVFLHNNITIRQKLVSGIAVIVLTMILAEEYGIFSNFGLENG